MFVFEGTCPHCGSDRGFSAFGMSPHSLDAEYFDYDRDFNCDVNLIIKATQGIIDTQFSLAGTCVACRKPVVAMCAAVEKIRKEIEKCVYSKAMTTNTVEIIQLFPEPVPPYSHASLPTDVAATFVDLQVMLQQHLRPHLIIAGCRIVLEAAAKNLGGDGKTLRDRILHLRQQGKITEDLKLWADHIRYAGNDATHDMDGKHVDAHELVEFTKLFLQFTFEMPSRIAEARHS